MEGLPFSFRGLGGKLLQPSAEYGEASIRNGFTEAIENILSRHLLICALGCLFFLLASVDSIAQPVPECRWETFQVAGPNGACCNVRVRWCDQVSAGVYMQEIDSIEQPTMDQGYDCASLGANYMLQVIRKKLILKWGHQNHQICPQYAPRVYRQTHSSCYKMENGFLVPCGVSKCVWTCNVCITPKERGNCTGDPLEDYNVFYVNCSVIVGSCVGITGCTINVCD